MAKISTSIFLIFLISMNIIFINSVKFGSADSLLAENSIRGQLTQMLVEVQTTDNITTIQKFLDVIRSMIQRIDNEEDEHKEVHKKMLSQCKQEQAFRVKEVSEASNAQRRALEARAKCDNSLKAALKDLPELENTKMTYETELKRAQNQRENENKRYKQRKQDYEEAISFLKDFSQYMNSKFRDNLKKTSFIEMSEKLLKHASKLGMLTEAVPVLVAIAEHGEELPNNNKYSYTPNENLENKLKNTLNQLLSRLQHDWEDNEEVETKADTIFNKYRGKIQSLLNSLEKSLDVTKQQVDGMTKCVQEEDSIATQAGSKNARNSKILDNAVSMCDRFDKEFVEATENRLEEIKTIEQILNIIKKRFGKVPNKLDNYLNNIKNSWSAYMSSIEYKGYLEYKTRQVKNRKIEISFFK